MLGNVVFLPLNGAMSLDGEIPGEVSLSVLGFLLQETNIRIRNKIISYNLVLHDVELLKQTKFKSVTPENGILVLRRTTQCHALLETM